MTIKTATPHVAGPVSIDGFVTVLGQYDPTDRWNGWINPRIDPLAVEQVLLALATDPMTEDAPRHEWLEHGELFLRDSHGSWHVYPDEDGLYALGAYSWVWRAEA